MDALIFVGLPVRAFGKHLQRGGSPEQRKDSWYCAKNHLPNYNEFYEQRQFAAAEEAVEHIQVEGECIPFGAKLLFACRGAFGEFTVAAEICEDLWVPLPPSVSHAQAGAHIVVNLSASERGCRKASTAEAWWRAVRTPCVRLRVCQRRRGIHAGCGFSSQNMIVENGAVLAEGALSGRDCRQRD